MAPVLETRGLDKHFGGIIAANEVSLKIEKGARHALIGPNGAGKTTVVNLLTGMLRPTAGQILLDGNDITHVQPHERVRLGIARTFQINQLFADLTPIEALGLAISERLGRGRDWWRIVGSDPSVTDEIVGLIERFRLGDVMRERTGILPYGKQRLLEIALALATRPKVLLLDEPAAGVPQEESGDVFEAVANLSDDLTLLFIEHDMHVVFRFASHIIVLVGGAIFTQGSPAEISADPRVREVYLGTRNHG